MNRRGFMLWAAVLCAAMAFASSAAETVWMDEMDLSTMTCGKIRPKVSKGPNDKPICLDGKTYEHGVGVLPDSVYDVVTGGKAISFSAKVGINDDAETNGSVRFRVWTDGVCVYDSGAILARPKGQKEPPRDVKVDLRGVRIATLHVTRGKQGTWFNHGVWADAVFTFEDGCRPLDPKRGARQLGILTPPESAAPRINGPAVYGVRPGHPVVYRVPVTGERPMRLTVQGLEGGELKGLAFDGDRQVLSGIAPEKTGSYRLLFKAENARGVATRELDMVVGDKIALTPPMGWNSWNAYGSNVSGEHILKTAGWMVEKGLADHGWSYVNIDDYWQNQPELKPWCKRKELGAPCRAADGTIIPNVFFNMPDITAKLHALGLKAGIYSSPGPTTCGGCEGSWRHEAKDAAQYAAWGFDYLKYDWCSYKDVATGEGLERNIKPYRLMGEELAKQPRDIVFTLCQYGEKGVSEWGESVGGNCWRISDDIFDSWGSVLYALDSIRPAARNSKPGAWNDADALVVGAMRPRGPVPHAAVLSPNERYTHVSLWALSASPLMIGCRIDELDDFTRSLLVNDEVIEVDQDPLGKGGEPVQVDEWSEVWLKPMSDGSYVVALFNRGLPEQLVAFDLQKAGLEGAWSVRDLWRQQHEGVARGIYSVSVPGHATHLVRLSRIKTDAVCLDKGWSEVDRGPVVLRACADRFSCSARQRWRLP